MRIGSLEVGPGHPCAIIAEIGNAHNQDFDRALRLLDAAKAAGASAAKLQCYSVEELIALRGDGPAPEPWHRYTMAELYTRAMTPRDWFPKLYAHAAGIGLPLFSSAFGAESVALLESCENPAYKLAALDDGQRELWDMVHATGKPVIRSSRHSFPPVTDELHLWCPQGYPQPKPVLRMLRRGYDGFSHHGTTWHVPAAAAVMGAAMVECHFHLAGEPSELEASVSITDHDFATLVDIVRRVEEML